MFWFVSVLPHHLSILPPVLLLNHSELFSKPLRHFESDLTMKDVCGDCLVAVQQTLPARNLAEKALKWSLGEPVSPVFTSCSKLSGSAFWPNIYACHSCYFCRLFFRSYNLLCNSIFILLCIGLNTSQALVFEQCWPHLGFTKALGMRGVKS